MAYQVVSIVGRPNVGKSTLFNRLSGRRKAIVEDTPGVTRDRIYCECEHRGFKFLLCDTGGFDLEEKDEIHLEIRRQIERTLDESALIIFLLDAKDGLLPEDLRISSILRRLGKPVLYVVNKVDSQRDLIGISEFYEIGADRLVHISALHGKNVAELLDQVVEILSSSCSSEKELEEDISEPLKVAIIGRPNTGKSSIVNAILGERRVIVSSIPGTTRDAIDTDFFFEGRKVRIVDTAGIRRKSKVDSGLEVKSISSAIRTIERSDVVNLIVDAEEGIGHQEASLVNTVIRRGKGLVVVINKWDLLDGKVAENDYLELARERLPHASFSPFLLVSALTGKNIEMIIRTDLEVEKELKKRIETSRLNRDLKEILSRREPPSPYGKRIKIYYGVQVSTKPPSFLFFSNFPELIPENYKRYLENSLRERYTFLGSPIRIKFRKS